MRAWSWLCATTCLLNASQGSLPGQLVVSEAHRLCLCARGPAWTSALLLSHCLLIMVAEKLYPVGQLQWGPKSVRSVHYAPNLTPSIAFLGMLNGEEEQVHFSMRKWELPMTWGAVESCSAGAGRAHQLWEREGGAMALGCLRSLGLVLPEPNLFVA